MELAVNFLVMLILSIVIFGFGIYLVSAIFGEAELQQGQVSAQVEAEVQNRLFKGGEAVAIPWNNEKLGIGDAHTFGLGILNTFSEKKTFNIYVTYVEVFDRLGKQAPQDLGTDQGYINSHWIFTEQPPVELNPNEHAVVSLPVMVGNLISENSPTQRNYLYKFNVCVVDADKPAVNCDNPTREEVRDGMHGGQALSFLVEVI